MLDSSKRSTNSGQNGGQASSFRMQHHLQSDRHDGEIFQIIGWIFTDRSAGNRVRLWRRAAPFHAEITLRGRGLCRVFSSWNLQGRAIRHLMVPVLRGNTRLPASTPCGIFRLRRREITQSQGRIRSIARRGISGDFDRQAPHQWLRSKNDRQCAGSQCQRPILNAKLHRSQQVQSCGIVKSEAKRTAPCFDVFDRSGQ